jgi:FkbH-like protein
MSEIPSSATTSDIKALVTDGRHIEALAILARLARFDDEFVNQRKHARLFRVMEKAGLGLRPLKLALLASSTTDHLVEVLTLWLALEGFVAEIYTSPFDTVPQTVVDPSSGLYAFNPDIVWFFSGWRDLRISAPPGADRAQVEEAVSAAVDATAELWMKLRDYSPAVIVQNNADIPAIDVFGNHEANVHWSARSLMRRYNLALADRVESGICIFDLDHLSGVYGKDRWSEQRHWHHSKHAITFDALGLTCFSFARIAGALKGQSKKCLVLDLDNTLWGGVIGDDGIEGIKLGSGADGEAFVHFQKYVLALKNRGVILAVCSKNEAAIASEAFANHPDMQLRLEDIAVFRVNWDNKADNIRAIADSLNIGLDSIVFVDDNPAERALVRKFLPMVAVPELPEDPAGYVEALHRNRYFETVSFSREDGQRADYYRANARRDEMRRQFTDQTAFQQSLLMEAEIGGVEGFYLSRSSQLINKSNQFHLTGVRYSDAEVSAILKRVDWVGRHFILRDRFGDNGLISVVLLRRDGRRLHIDTWVMSCRVLGRCMEEFIANEIIKVARETGCSSIIGRYVPSKKNKLVENLYQRLGFALVSADNGITEWEMDAQTASLLPNSIALGGCDVSLNSRQAGGCPDDRSA